MWGVCRVGKGVELLVCFFEIIGVGLLWLGVLFWRWSLNVVVFDLVFLVICLR